MKLITPVRLSKTFLIITLTLLLQACSSPLGALTGALSPIPDVGVQVGEEANKQIVNKQEKTNTEIDISTEGDVHQSTENSNTEIFNTNIPLSYQLLMILGWILPSPKEIYKGLKRELASLFNLFKKIS